MEEAWVALVVGVVEVVPITVVQEVEGEEAGEDEALSHFVCRSHCNKWFCIEEHFQIIV